MDQLQALKREVISAGCGVRYARQAAERYPQYRPAFVSLQSALKYEAACIERLERACAVFSSPTKGRVA